MSEMSHEVAADKTDQPVKDRSRLPFDTSTSSSCQSSAREGKKKKKRKKQAVAAAASPQAAAAPKPATTSLSELHPNHSITGDMEAEYESSGNDSSGCSIREPREHQHHLDELVMQIMQLVESLDTLPGHNFPNGKPSPEFVREQLEAVLQRHGDYMP